MTVQVLLPGILAALTGGAKHLDVEPQGETLADLLDALATEHALLGRRIRDETGQVLGTFVPTVDYEELERKRPPLTDEELQLAFRKRFGRRWRSFYDDLREAHDPEAFTVAKVPFHSDNTGRIEPRLNLNVLPDLGSIKPRNAEVAGPDAGKASIRGDKLKEGVDELLQRDQLDNDKAHAGDKPGFDPPPNDRRPGWEKADETLKDVHD